MNWLPDLRKGIAASVAFVGTIISQSLIVGTAAKWAAVVASFVSALAVIFLPNGSSSS